MTKGVLLIAVNFEGTKKGEIYIYAKLVWNMANSIKKSNPNTHITVLTDDTCLVRIHDKSVFDDIIEVPMCYYVDKNVYSPFRLKTYIYDLSPYDKTLYLDVDGLYIGKKGIDSLFEELDGLDVQTQEVGRYTLANQDECDMVWLKEVGLKLEDLYEAYDLPKDAVYPEYNSSIVYFEKGERAEKYFRQVKILYSDRRTKYRPIGRYYPDEMSYNLASVMANLYMVKEAYKPIFFSWEHPKDALTKGMGYISETKHILGMAGGHIRPNLKRLYTQFASMQGSPFTEIKWTDKSFHHK